MKKATSCVGAEKFIKSLPWKLGHLTLHGRTAWQSRMSLFAGYASSEMQGPFTAQLQQKCSFCSLCIWFFSFIFSLSARYNNTSLVSHIQSSVSGRIVSRRGKTFDKLFAGCWGGSSEWSAVGFVWLFFRVGWSASARVWPAATAVANRSASACIWNGRWTCTSHFWANVEDLYLVKIQFLLFLFFTGQMGLLCRVFFLTGVASKRQMVSLNKHNFP